MKKIIRIYIVILLLVIIGSIKMVMDAYENNKKIVIEKKEEDKIVEETTTISTTEFKRGELVKEYIDEDGVITREYSNGSILAELPDDVSTWTMSNMDMRESIIKDALWGRDLGLRYDYPITENFFKEYDKKGWINLEVLFPGFEFSRYNRYGDFGFRIDDFEKEDKEGMAHATIRCKYNKVRYDFKYYLTNDYKLDSIEYIGKEIVEDFSKQVEKDERTYLMIKDGDEIHQDNEYIIVLDQASDFHSEEYRPEFFDQMGIVEELKEKRNKNNETLLPIPNGIKYYAFCGITNTNYDKKVAEIYVSRAKEKNSKERIYEKYKIGFDYNEDYYLLDYYVLSCEEIDENEYMNELHKYSLFLNGRLVIE